MSDFDDWMSRAWDEHADQPQLVADQLPAALARFTESAHTPRLADLVSHVLGEHLGQWQAGIEMLDALPMHEGADAVVARQRAVLAHMGGDAGDPAALTALAGDEPVAAWAQVSAMAAGRGDIDRAVGAYRQALGLAIQGLADGSPALRALAVGGNNLAATLEALPQRSDDQTRAMLEAAQAGLTYWRRAGGWLEEERAAYRLARSQLQADRASAALASAALCLAVCEANDAPPFERFFAHAVQAMASRALGLQSGFAAARELARACRDAVAPDERAWCDDDWSAINKD